MLAPFYVILDTPGWLDRLAPHGLKLAQARFKNKTEKEALPLLCEALAKASKWDVTLVINDHWQAAIDLKASWVHLGQEDLETADLPALRRAGIRFGLSTHTQEELERALALEPDYIAAGPVFPARSKAVDYPSLGASGLAQWRKQVRCPLVAIGGITLEMADSLWAAGADSLCVISDVLAHPAPEARCRAWAQKTHPPQN